MSANNIMSTVGVAHEVRLADTHFVVYELVYVGSGAVGRATALAHRHRSARLASGQRPLRS